MLFQVSENREHLKTDDEDLVVEFGHLISHFKVACGTAADLPQFCAHVNEASARGASWIEAVRYAAEKRRGKLRPMLAALPETRRTAKVAGQ